MEPVSKASGIGVQQISVPLGTFDQTHFWTSQTIIL